MYNGVVFLGGLKPPWTPALGLLRQTSWGYQFGVLLRYISVTKYHHMYVGGGYPPKFKDFPILYKPLKIKFWDLGSITIFVAVKFREDWSNREVCSSLVAHFHCFFFFWGEVPLPKIMKNPFYCWVGVPPLKLRVT